MDQSLDALLRSLREVKDSDGFEDWTRNSLRRKVPHASLLCTIGKLYGSGSIPTHRIGVDYPLNMVEALKNSAGALDDPLLYGWFRTERIRHVHIDEAEEFGGQQQWRNVLVKYGMQSVIVHGVLEHKTRRFAAFQMYNPSPTSLPDNVRLLSLLTKSMAEAAWVTVDNRGMKNRCVTGHPTLSLTPTELHIIELLAQGLSNKEIARLRGVSDSTVKTQVQRTGAKVGATRRAEIVAIAMPMLSPLPPQSLLDYGD